MCSCTHSEDSSHEGTVLCRGRWPAWDSLQGCSILRHLSLGHIFYLPFITGAGVCNCHYSKETQHPIISGTSYSGTSAMLSSIAHHLLQDPSNCLSPTPLCLFLFVCRWCLGRHEEANIPPLAINVRLKRWFQLRLSLKGSCITEKSTSLRVTLYKLKAVLLKSPPLSTSAFASLPSGGAYRCGSSYNFPVSCVSLPLWFTAPPSHPQEGFFNPEDLAAG